MGRPDSLGDPEDLRRQLQKVLWNSVDVGVPGISAAIGNSKGIIWKSKAGYADIKNDIPINESHNFGIGSITKVFISIVILQLVEEKVLHLNDAVSDHLDEATYHAIKHAKEATIQELLSHRGGIESFEDDPKWIVDGRGKNLDPFRIWGKKDNLEYIRRDNDMKRGIYSYANTNYTLLGLIIEKVTHESAETEVRRRILEPLSLNDSFLEGFEKERGEVPRRYHWATETFIKEAGICPNFTQLKHQGQDLIDATGSNLSIEWEDGGMISSPNDLVKFATAIRDGQLLNKASMKLLLDWQPIPTNENGLEKEGENGLGLFRYQSQSGDRRWIGHHGDVLGFTGVMLWSEDKDCVISIVINVGSMHAGQVPQDAADVAFKTGFLELAFRLAAALSLDQ